MRAKIKECANSFFCGRTHDTEAARARGAWWRAGGQPPFRFSTPKPLPFGCRFQRPGRPSFEHQVDSGMLFAKFIFTSGTKPEFES